MPDHYREKAILLFEQRRARAAAFHPHQDIFHDHAWDLLLLLFIAYERAEAVSIGLAATSTGGRDASALRWLQALEERGLVTQVGRHKPVELEGRFTLTHSAVESMLRYLDGLATMIM
ncbi:hypothetical protein NF701_08260 [Sphingomonadaceae bacterium OTU29THOMA1]|nr:hypothetical protein NF701_08260 [Sphingomonadaceae bacterium OTU29THOMA1]